MPTTTRSLFATAPPDPPDLSNLPMELGGPDPYADPAAVAARAAAAAATAGPLPGSPPPRTLPLSPSGQVVSQVVASPPSRSPPVTSVPPPPSEALPSHGAGLVHLHAIGAGGGALAELIGVFKGSVALRDED